MRRWTGRRMWRARGAASRRGAGSTKTGRRCLFGPALKALLVVRHQTAVGTVSLDDAPGRGLLFVEARAPRVGECTFGTTMHSRTNERTNNGRHKTPTADYRLTYMTSVNKRGLAWISTYDHNGKSYFAPAVRASPTMYVTRCVTCPIPIPMRPTARSEVPRRALT